MGHHYGQLTQEERYQISAAMEMGQSLAEIARRLSRHRSTISREVRRNACAKGGYRPATAQRKSDKRRREAHKYRKGAAELNGWVEGRLRERWSPEQIAGSMKGYGFPLVSHEWIYRYVARDQARGGTLYLELRHQRRKYRRRYGSGRRGCRIPNRVGIEKRPEMVERRERFGDWEGDTVVGPGPAALLTLVERKSGLIVLRKVRGLRRS